MDYVQDGSYLVFTGSLDSAIILMNKLLNYMPYITALVIFALIVLKKRKNHGKTIESHAN